MAITNGINNSSQVFTSQTSLTATLGDVIITSGNLTLAYTNAAGTEGLITAGGVPLISTLGTGNTFVGVNVANLTFNTGFATSNTILGAIAFQNVTTGAFNTGLGYGTLSALLTGGSNIAIGVNAGQLLVGAESNNIYLAHQGVGAESNAVRIGTQGTQATAYCAGITGVTVANQNYVTINSTTGQLGVTSGSIVFGYTPVTNAASPYTVLATDYYIAVDCSGGPVSLLLPNAPTNYKTYTIKDVTGGAVANNITVTTVGGVVTLDGATSYVMNANYQAINVIFDGAGYQIY